MIKKVNIAKVAIGGGVVSVGAVVVHDDKNATDLQVGLELGGDEKLMAAADALIHQIKESMKTKLGIAPTFAE